MRQSLVTMWQSLVSTWQSFVNSGQLQTGVLAAIVSAVTVAVIAVIVVATPIGAGLGGTQGPVVYWGATSPEAADLSPAEDDLYLNTSTNRLWAFEGGTWGTAPLAELASQSDIPTTAAPGQDGAQGAPGDQGAQGPQGERGAQGATGNTGARGARGAPGIPGVQGLVGPQGPIGSQGPRGFNGADGADGANGADGEDGRDGARGSSGSSGATGSRGLQGPTGPAGSDGAKGDAGNPGRSGAPGAKGDSGAQGLYYIRVYQHANAAPSAPTGGTYVISTKTLTNVPTNWTKTPTTPGIGYKTYVTEATIDASGPTDSITPSWNTPYEAGSTGPAGPQGDQGAYFIPVFTNASTLPSTPTGGTFNLSTKSLIAPTGWTNNPTTPTLGQAVFSARASIDPSTDTGEFTPTWTVFPFQLNGTQGIQGKQGAQGAEGKEGKQGKIGLQGPTGLQGTPGTTGPTGLKGTDGAQGLYYIRVYQNAAAAPSAPTTGTYVISSKTLTVPTGWTTSPSTPTGTDKTYVTEATIDPSGSTDSITPSWNTPYEAGSSGPAGAKGDTGDAGVAGVKGDKGNIGNIGPRGRTGAQGLYYIRIYQNAASEPATPTGGSYNIASYILTPPTGWSKDFTTPTGTDKTYISEAKVNPQTPTNVFTPTWDTLYVAGGTGPAGAKGDTGDTGAPGTTGATGEQGAAGARGFRGPTGPAGEDGAAGTQGLFYVRVFKNSATAITTAPTGGTYVISTKTLTAPTGWTLTPATLSGNETTYVTEATIDPATADGSSTPSWNTPYEAGSSGPAGAKGDKGDTGTAGTAGAAGAAGAAGTNGAQGSYTVRIYTKKSNAAPSTPTGGSWNVGTKTLTSVPNGWSATPPASVTSIERIYAAEVTIDPSTQSGDVTITWGAPYQFGGKDGISGGRGFPGKVGPAGAAGTDGTQWFMQSDAPTTANVTINTGDIWIDTSTGGDCGKASVHSGTSWVAQTSWAMDITCS